MKKIIYIWIIIFLLIISALTTFTIFYLQKNKINKIPPQDKTITAEDLKKEMDYLKEKINIDPETKNIDPENYPVILGKYYKNGIILKEIYFCSDLCPDYGAVYIVFDNINSKEECEKIQGKELIDHAWGGYVGCEPKIE